MKHVLLLAALMQAPMTEPLVGRWDAEARSRGGLGTWMTLSADHTTPRRGPELRAPAIVRTLLVRQRSGFGEAELSPASES